MAKNRLKTFMLIFAAFISEEFQGLFAGPKLLRKYLGISPGPLIFLGILDCTAKVLVFVVIFEARTWRFGDFPRQGRRHRMSCSHGGK